MNPAITGPELKQWRKRARLTQELLARKLGVTREWIGQLEASERPISAKVFLRFDALRREEEFASGDDENAKFNVNQAAQAEYAPLDALDSLRQEIRAELERTIAAARDDAARLGWIREQVREHLAAPKSWRDLNDEAREHAKKLHEAADKHREQSGDHARRAG